MWRIQSNSGPVVSKEVLSHFWRGDRSQSHTTDFNDSEPLKAPGIWWNTKTDHFIFSIPKTVLNVNDPRTKQTLFSIASKVFDLMGLNTHLLFWAYILFQDLWQRELQWEDHLNKDIHVAAWWGSWKSELSKLSCSIPCYLMAHSGANSKIELHGFTNALPCRALFNPPDIHEDASENDSTARECYLYQQKLINHFCRPGKEFHKLNCIQQ